MRILKITLLLLVLTTNIFATPIEIVVEDNFIDIELVKEEKRHADIMDKLLRAREIINQARKEINDETEIESADKEDE